MSDFYEEILRATATSEPSGVIRLTSTQNEVLLHTVPQEFAKSIEVKITPDAREDSPIKPVFEVTILDIALDSVRSHGGVVTSRHFVSNGLKHHDVLDPDGNVIQLRSHN